MIRDVPFQSDWCEMTMTMLRDKQFEACEARLEALPPVHLFDKAATDADAQTLYEYSYDGDKNTLVPLKKLRDKVLKRLPMEAGAVTLPERQLLEKLILFDGTVLLDDEDDMAAVEGLTRRLWCRAYPDGEGWVLFMPPEILSEMIDALSNVPEERIPTLFRFDAMIHSMLYLQGVMSYASYWDILRKDILKDSSPTAEKIARWYFQSCCDYLPTAHGDLILMHPGVADPSRIHFPDTVETLVLRESEAELVLGAMNNLLPEERPLQEAMQGALNGATRHEYTPGEAAEDLRLLAKQGLSYAELFRVLTSMVQVLPTPRMEAALHEIHDRTPRWSMMEPGRIN